MLENLMFQLEENKHDLERITTRNKLTLIQFKNFIYNLKNVRLFIEC